MAAEDAPVLVVVDDAPWVDAASLEALRFAARRLDADRVGFLFAARERVGGAAARGGLESLTVGGLDTAEAVGLVNEFARSPVAASVARALAEAGGGHPLWLREAARELSPEQMAGAAPLTDRFRAPASVQEAFERLALSLSAQARAALVVLGADEQAPAPVMQQALADLGIARERDPGRHRLWAGAPRGRAAAVLASARAGRRARGRRRRRSGGSLMRRSRGPGATRASPSARPGTSPRPATGRTRTSRSALAGVARAARARGAPGAAAEAWRRAVETAPDADQALPLRLERARDLAQAGRASEALVELDEILDRGPVAELRADAEILQGQLLISQGRIEQAARVLEAGAARIQDRDPARAAVMLCGAAFAKASHGEVTAAVATAEAAVALAGPLGGVGGGGRVDARVDLDRCRGGRPRLSAAAAPRRARRPVRASAGRLVGPLASRPVRVLDGGLRHRASRARARGRPRARAAVSSATCRSR